MKKGGDHHRWWRVRLLLCIAEGGRNYRKSVKCAQKFKKIIVIILFGMVRFFSTYGTTQNGEEGCSVL